MPKWSNIIRKPSSGADGVLNTLSWNRIDEVLKMNSENGFLPNTDNGPDNIPSDIKNVCFIKCSGTWPTYSASKTQFNCDFVAPFDMVLTKIKFRGRQDVPTASATEWGAQIKAFVNGRAKKIRPEIGHLRDDNWDIWDLLMNANWSGIDQVLTIRPIVVPRGSHVTIQLNMQLFVVSGTDWVRIGNVQLGYRAPMSRAQLNFNYNNETRSWLSTRKETLPSDSMKLSIKVLDAEETEVGNNSTIKGYHGPSANIPLAPFPLALTSEGIFNTFQISGTPGTETLKFTSEDADGQNLQLSEGNWLGLERRYDDKILGMIPDPQNNNAPTYPDDDPYNNTINLTALTDSFTVKKRTPIITLNQLIPQPRLGDMLHFYGIINDPDQPGLFDFIAGLNANIIRDSRQLENGLARNDGTFDVARTLSLDDVGQNRQYSIKSSESSQYNMASSALQTRTVLQIISTRIDLFLDARLPYLGTKFNLTGSLTQLDGSPISNMPVKIAEDASAHIGITNILGQFTYAKLLDVEGTINVQALFDQQLIDGYKQFEASTSDIKQILAIKQQIASYISKFLLTKSSIQLGEIIGFEISLAKASGEVLGPTTVTLQRQDPSGSWINIKQFEIDQYGNGTGSWDPSELLAGQNSISISCRVVYLGGSKQTVEPWEYYMPSESDMKTFTLNSLNPLLGHIALNAKLDNKDFSEIPGTKTILFTISPADAFNNTQFDHPQTIDVNPGRYNITCTLNASGLNFTKNDSRDVTAGDTPVPMEFSFASEEPPAGKGRLNVSITSSRTIVNSGESIEVFGTVMFPSKLRSVPLRRIRVRIKEETKTLATVRTDLQGSYAATLTLPLGEHLLFAEISGPLGNFSIAKSPSIRIRVV